MNLTDDQIDEIASAYHEACDEYRRKKREAYKDWPPNLIPSGAFKVCPAAWIPDVASAVMKIARDREEK